MYKKISLLIILFLIAGYCFSQEEAGLLRFPDVRGDQLVFTKSGDLYTADAEGGIARKLTSHKGNEIFAKISPNGEYIAFTGQYDGNTEVYVMPAEGGKPKRLTYTATLSRDALTDRMGPNNIVMGWTPDSKHIIYRSRRYSFNSFKGQLFKVSVEGGLSQEIPLKEAGFNSYAPNGEKLAFNEIFREFRTWKYYRGGMTGDIKIYNFNTESIQKITSHEAQDIFPMWMDDEIYFLSDRDRTMNMFVYDTTDQEINKVTNFTNYDIKFPSGGDEKIAFENGGDIYLFNTETKEHNKVTIRIANDHLSSRNKREDASENIYSSDISPNGKRAVFSGRGDIFNVPVEEGVTKNMSKTSGIRERDVAWSPNGKHIAYISDKTGEFELYIRPADGSGDARQLTENADTYKFKAKWSPDSKKLMWSDRKFRLKYVNIESGNVTLVDENTKGRYRNYSWSPDSRYITYVPGSGKEMSKVYVYDTQSEEKHQISPSKYDSNSPAFSKDGKYLFFVSQTEYNPVYNEAEWNVAYQDMEQLHLVTLEKSTPSPFADKDPKVEQDDKNKENGDKEDGKQEETSPEIQIDFENIRNRVIALPVEAANYHHLTGLKDKVLYNYHSRGKDEHALKVYDLEKEKEHKLAGKVGYNLSASGKKIMLKKGNKYYVTDFSPASLNLEKPIDLSDMKVEVDRKKEWEQIFDEAWRQMRDFFYVPNMHGVDWEAMHDKYAKLLPHVQHRADLTYIIGEMISELNVGHSYVTGGDSRDAERIKTGLLGAKLNRDKSGYYKIHTILPSANWEKKRQNPLTKVGVDVSEGDYIIAINGVPTKNMENIYASLVGKANTSVELTINSTPEKSGSHKEIIKPLAGESELYYYKWFSENKKKIDTATNGQAGYIHIRDMMRTGLRDFMSNYYPQLNKKGLVIDVRGNGGGNVSPMLIERLRREITRCNMKRNSEVVGYTPNEAFHGPMVLLMDEYSASDGDLFAYSFKKHDLGKTVGTRTWGGVVGISSPIPFVDGGQMYKPEFASYSAEESEWIIEGNGVAPDIKVENNPHKVYKGKDQQLQKAIEIMKEELKDYEPLPDIPEPPDKSGE